MTDTEQLNVLIGKSGYKKSWIAQQLGLSRYGFTLKLNNKNQFNAYEIQKLCEILKITDLAVKDNIFLLMCRQKFNTKAPKPEKAS